VLSKTFGGNNPVNTVRATIKALGMLRDPQAERIRRLGLADVHTPEVETVSEEAPEAENGTPTATESVDEVDESAANDATVDSEDDNKSE
jgi:hypothetical protein